MCNFYYKGQFLLLLFILCFSLYGQTDNGKIKIAFPGLEPRGDLTNGLEETVKDILLAEIINTSAFEIIERNKIDDLLNEQTLQVSGIIDTASNEELIEIGKIVAVKLLLLGSIGVLDNKTAVTVRLVDAESGKIVFANSLVCRPDELSDGLRVLAREISRNGLQTTLQPSMEKIRQARENGNPREALLLARKMQESETSPEITAMVDELMKETADSVYKEAKKALRKSAWDNAVLLADEAVLLDPSPQYMEFRYKVLSRRDDAYRKESLEKEKLQRAEEERREKEAAGLYTFGDRVENYYKRIEPGGFQLGYASGITRDSQQQPEDLFSWSGLEFSYSGIQNNEKSWINNAWSASLILSVQDSLNDEKDIVLYAYGSPFSTLYYGAGNLFFSNALDAGVILQHSPSRKMDYGASLGYQGTLQIKFLQTIGLYCSVRLEYDWFLTTRDSSDMHTRWSVGIVL